MERLRLVSDRDSIGTASSLSRASAAGDRRRWRKYGESSTLMVGATQPHTQNTHTHTHTHTHTGAKILHISKLTFSVHT